MIVPQIPELALFSAVALIVFMFVVVAAGMFPAEHRTPDLRGAVGSALLWMSIIAMGVVAIRAVAFAIATLPWYAAVIAGGSMLLAAPFVLGLLPPSLADNRTGIVGLAAVGIVLGGATWAL